MLKEEEEGMQNMNSMTRIRTLPTVDALGTDGIDQSGGGVGGGGG